MSDLTAATPLFDRPPRPQFTPEVREAVVVLVRSFISLGLVQPGEFASVESDWERVMSAPRWFDSAISRYLPEAVDDLLFEIGFPED